MIVTLILIATFRLHTAGLRQAIVSIYLLELLLLLLLLVIHQSLTTTVVQIV